MTRMRRCSCWPIAWPAACAASSHRHRLPWCVTQVGARTEFQFSEQPPADGSAAGLILDGELEQIIHLFLLNRGLLITPFHNMMLVCPHTQAQDIDRLLAAFDDCLQQLAS